MKEKGLGKGLSALLLTKKEVKEEIVEIPVDSIKPNPYQPRKSFDEEKLKEMADTIKERGILEPLLVRKSASGYELISGERRLRAAKIAGLEKVPCLVRTITDDESLELALIENLQREDLNPVEEARAYRVLKERFGMTQEEIADKVGKDRATVANTMRLLKLPEEVLNGLAQGKISEGHAKILLSLQSEREIINYYRKVIKSSLSVRNLEKLLFKKKKEERREDPNLKRVIKSLEEFFHSKVSIGISRDGKGTIHIKFSSIDHLNDILERIGIRDTL
jgi:ParB family chromosome partitioning protein